MNEVVCRFHDEMVVFETNPSESTGIEVCSLSKEEKDNQGFHSGELNSNNRSILNVGLLAMNYVECAHAKAMSY